MCHRLRLCLPELSLNNNVVNPDFLKNRSLFFFRENNELFWNRCTERTQRDDSSAVLSYSGFICKCTQRKSHLRVPKGTADLLRANHTGLFLEEHSICTQ